MTTNFMHVMADRAASTSGVRGRLWQNQTWTDSLGQVHRISDIDERYLGNILGYLNINAKRLLEGARAAMLLMPYPNGEQAGYAFEDELQRLQSITPKEWLSEKPLYKALKQRKAELEADDAEAQFRRKVLVSLSECHRQVRGVIPVIPQYLRDRERMADVVEDLQSMPTSDILVLGVYITRMAEDRLNPQATRA